MTPEEKDLLSDDQPGLIGYVFAALAIAVMCFLFALIIVACKK